jgi:hypothetical protein
VLETVWELPKAPDGRPTGANHATPGLTTPGPTTPEEPAPPAPAIGVVEMPRLTDFPKTDAAVRQRCPTADMIMVTKILHAAAQAYTSVKDPQIPPLNDADFAEAVAQAVAESPQQTSAALFLRTVPNVVKSWAELGRHPPIPKGPKSATQRKMDLIDRC